jgi:hypothetical protein
MTTSVNLPACCTGVGVCCPSSSLMLKRLNMGRQHRLIFQQCLLRDSQFDQPHLNGYYARQTVRDLRRRSMTVTINRR